MKRTEIAQAVRTERAKLVADLRTLDEAAWSTPSLCSLWSVRDVVAHLIRVGDFYKRPWTFEWDLLRYRFRLGRALAGVAKRMAARMSTDELLDRLDRSAYEDTLVFRLHPQPVFALAEWIVHGQDIRRPLGLRAVFEREHLIATAEVAMKWYTWESRRRRAISDGPVRLEATDAEWSVGQSTVGRPVFRGPLEAIVMVVFGRTSAMDDLERAPA